VSDHEPREMQALRQLELLVRHLGEELATFRRRALQAEGKLKSFESSSPSGDLFAIQQAAQLQRENDELRARIAFATDRTKGFLEQVRFLRQQAARPVTNSGNDR
jgi:hypothetical protein